MGEVSNDAVEREARAALPLLERSGDHAGLAEVWEVLYGVAAGRGRNADGLAAVEHAIEHARLAGRSQADLFDWVVTALYWGPWPADEALQRLDRLVPEPRSPYVLSMRAGLIAMLDRFDEAWSVAEEQCARLRYGGYSGEMTLGFIAAAAGEDETAVRHLQTACEEFEAVGSYGLLGTTQFELARSLFLLGRYDEFERVFDADERLTQRLVELGTVDIAGSGDRKSQLRALAHLHRGEYAEAERLAREAVGLAQQSDELLTQADIYFDLAQILETAGRPNEAADAYGEALDRYERKKIIPLARRTRERLAALPRESAHSPMSPATKRATIAAGSSTTEGGRDGHRVQPTGRARRRREDQRPPRR